MASEKKIGLRFEKAVPADELQEGQIVVIDGHVVEATPDPADGNRLRIVVDRLLAGVDEDHRTVVVVVPRDMRIATASRFDGEAIPPVGP